MPLFTWSNFLEVCKRVNSTDDKILNNELVSLKTIKIFLIKLTRFRFFLFTFFYVFISLYVKKYIFFINKVYLLDAKNEAEYHTIVYLQTTVSFKKSFL